MIVYLVGTKAQYIKVAPVILETERRGLPYTLVYTGQHSETFSDLQRNFGLRGPDHVLVDTEEARDRSSFARWAYRAWRATSRRDLLDVYHTARALVIHGDTASTLLGALAGRRHRVPVAHIEAGLRSFNFRHPFPEEAIRVAVSHLSHIHFCPDDQAVANLDRARIRGERVMTAGNTLIDSLRLAGAHDGAPGATAPDDVPYAVFSVHRQENLFRRERLDRILGLVRDFAAIMPVRFVLHPVTRTRLERLGLLEPLGRIDRLALLPRMEFFEFNRLLRGARVVVTDGGSNQEECAALGIPCVLLRHATERPDGLGDNVWLCDLDTPRILDIGRDLLGRAPSAKPLPEASPSRLIIDRLEALCDDPAA